MDLVNSLLAFLAGLFILAVGLGVALVIVLYIMDVTQTRHAIRRNFPVVGRFRYFFEHLGEFFRQYFFAMDREELPFNRAQRSWAYRAAKNIDNTVPFGSTRDLSPPGTVFFVNYPFPTLDEEALSSDAIQFGSECAQPYLARSIVNISAMSYGALSRPAVLALSRGAKKAGCWMNTGEGGLSNAHLEGGADIVFQIGTAKYGVRDLDGKLSDDKLRDLARHDAIRMFEIKLSQGAKPGKGGILPGAKVTAEIAAVRGIPVGHDSISPNRHPEIEMTSDILDLVHRVRSVTGKPTGIKLVVGDPRWLDELCACIRDRGLDAAPDFITVDGAEGGTGAAPLPLIDSVGLPLREALPALVDKLIEHGLRDRIRVVASGKLINPSMVAWALCIGADVCVSARGFMFALGCIQAMQCNKNTCPTGITTHDPDLQRGLVPSEKAERVAHYHHNLVHEVEIIAHSCGVRSPRGFTRQHAREVCYDGCSRPLDELYPYPKARLSA